MRWIDIPPAWLALFLLLGWGQARVAPVVDFPGWLSGAGAGLALAGVALMLWAAGTLMRKGTTVMPHDQPRRMVTDGPFGFSRNPIYLADAMILAGLSLWWGSLLGLVALPAFVVLVRKRFILPEESRLAAAFGPAFDAYVRRVRRWI